MTTVYINELFGELPWRWSVEFDYHPGLIAAIKANVPARARKWDCDNRRWLFKEGWLLAAEELCQRHCRQVKYGEPKPSREETRLRQRGHFKQIIKLQVAAITRKAA